jgi:two-component system response regulator DegU
LDGEDISVVKVLLAHESRLVRQALDKILSIQDGITVVGHAASGPDTVRKIEELKPDVLVLNLSLPRLNGMLPKNVELENDQTMVVAPVADLGSTKAMKYLSYNDTLGKLIGAVIAAGGEESLVSHIYSKSEALENLTGREKQILRLVADGLSNRQISVDMKITERTVKYHISNILRKLDLFSRTEAAILFLKGNLQDVAH